VTYYQQIRAIVDLPGIAGQSDLGGRRRASAHHVPAMVATVRASPMDPRHEWPHRIRSDVRLADEPRQCEAPPTAQQVHRGVPVISAAASERGSGTRVIEGVSDGQFVLKEENL
jgi:hypothetical protein